MAAAPPAANGLDLALEPHVCCRITFESVLSFLHLEVEPDFESFKAYALEAGVHEQILAFLSFRTTLMHKLDPRQPAWPSPRSWVMASSLHGAGLDIAPVVGAAAAAEFGAFLELYQALPDLQTILRGAGSAIAFPGEPSARYASVIGLAVRAENAQEAHHAFTWLANTAAAYSFKAPTPRTPERRGSL